MIVWVVAAALISEDGAILVQKRAAGRKMAGLWEFPGGKIEPGEIPEHALIRELREELAIEVSAADLRPVSFATAPLGVDHLVLMLYVCQRWLGRPRSLDAELIAWVTPDELSALAMPPADEPLVAALRRDKSLWCPAGQEQ